MYKHNVCNELFIYFFTEGDEVYVKMGSASDNRPLQCENNMCGFTGFLMKSAGNTMHLVFLNNHVIIIMEMMTY